MLHSTQNDALQQGIFSTYYTLGTPEFQNAHDRPLKTTWECCKRGSIVAHVHLQEIAASQ
jgi:hypothetical protein